MNQLTNSELVEIVYKNHHKWISQVAYNFTKDINSAEDITQEVYEYLMDMKNINKIRYNGTVNLFYIYKTIKSKFLNSIKQSKKVTILPVEEDYLEIEDKEYDLDKDSKFESMLEATKHLLEHEIHWFDSRLLITYLDENHSIASLHKATGISKSSIWTSLDKSKKYIKNSYDKIEKEQKDSNSVHGE